MIIAIAKWTVLIAFFLAMIPIVALSYLSQYPRRLLRWVDTVTVGWPSRGV